MSTIVIMPGGFHPFHAGHYELYKSALEKFPGADVYVAASNDTSERPFPFSIKEKLAKVAGIPPGRFVQVKSPFSAEEITSKYDPNKTVLIFVKSEKNAKNGSDPEGPFPAEIDPRTGKLPLVTRGARKGQPVSTRLQYYKGNEDNLQPMSRHSYLAYLPTVEFGPGIKSGSELRNMWPKLDDRRKTAFVMSMYPATQKNLKLAQVVVKMIDAGMGGQQGVAEGLNEMDKSAPQPGRDGKVSHSTYGSREKKGSDYFKGKEAPGKPITKKQMEKHALDILKKQGVAESKEDKIAQLKKDHATAVHWSKNEKSPQKREAARQKAEKIKRHLETQYKQDVAEGSEEKDNLIWMLNSFGYYSDNSSVYVNDGGDKIVRVGSEWKHQSGKRGRGPEELGTFLSSLQNVNEGEVIPFSRKPQPKLTWQQVPKDVLLLANEWYWADYEDGSLDAVLDPKGYGNGTANELQYITAKLQQKGWAIEHDLDDNGPDQFNMKLTNKRGQSVLLSWDDANNFTGWAAGTRPVRENDGNMYRRPSSGEVSRVSQQTRAKLNPVRSQFVWKKPNQIGGSFSEQELLSKGFKKSQYNAWGGTQNMWDKLLGVKEARVFFNDPNTKVNVYYNSRNPKYYGKPVQVGKEIPYNKIDKFINMIVDKYQVKPTEFIWTDSTRDRTDAHIVHEMNDYLEEK